MKGLPATGPTLDFPNLLQSNISFAKDKQGVGLPITLTGKTIRLTDWTLGANYQVDIFHRQDGNLAAAQLNAKI